MLSSAPRACRRWYITLAAMNDYRRAVARDMDDAQVRVELEPLSERAEQVKQYPNGKQLYLGEAIDRRPLRLVVMPPKRPRHLPSLIAVAPLDPEQAP